MRFALLFVAAGSLLGCPAPVEEDPRDAGFIVPDAGCPTRCQSDETLCGCECVRTSSDRDHCGGCDQACEPAAESLSGWTCLEGACSCNTQGEPGLCDGTPTSTCCNDRTGTACFDLTTSLDHCGSCTNTCDRYVQNPTPEIPNPGISDHCENAQCVCGMLGRACEGTLDSTCCMDDADADGFGDPDTARCSDLLTGGTDVEPGENDCGACGIQCPADALAPEGDRCRNGQCVCGPGTPEVPATACPAGQICCGTGKTAVCAPAGSCG